MRRDPVWGDNPLKDLLKAKYVEVLSDEGLIDYAHEVRRYLLQKYDGILLDMSRSDSRLLEEISDELKERHLTLRG